MQNVIGALYGVDVTPLLASVPTPTLDIVVEDHWIDLREEARRLATGLSNAERGDARGRDVLREHERITRETLKQYGGDVVKTMGDGFMASFGSATAAVECAIALQRAFASHTDSMPEPLHVRVGLNAGEPIEEDGDLFGSTVIVASRIAAEAGAGEILVPHGARVGVGQELRVLGPRTDLDAARPEHSVTKSSDGRAATDAFAAHADSFECLRGEE